MEDDFIVPERDPTKSYLAKYCKVCGQRMKRIRIEVGHFIKFKGVPYVCSSPSVITILDGIAPLPRKNNMRAPHKKYEDHLCYMIVVEGMLESKYRRNIGLDLMDRKAHKLRKVAKTTFRIVPMTIKQYSFDIRSIIK